MDARLSDFVVDWCLVVISLVLLVAGEGSRLWGISAAVGMVKGLTNILGTTLLEQVSQTSINNNNNNNNND
jgi:hypothetical protein